MSDAIDRLARYRKTETAAERPQASTASADDYEHYLAFKAVDRAQRRLLIKPVGAAQEFLPFHYLLRVVLDPKQARLALIFSFMAVTLTGRNLGPIAEAVASEHCEFIEQFDSKQWKRPAPDAPIIETIEFVTERESPETA